MAKPDDVKAECFTLWTQSFEDVWNKNNLFSVPRTSETGSGSLKSKNLIPRLMLNAACSCFVDQLERQEAQLDAAEKKIKRLEEVLASVADSRILNDVTTRIDSPDLDCEKGMIDPVIKRSITPTKIEECSPTNGTDRSPSLLHHEPRKCLQRGSPKNKENKLSGISSHNDEKSRESPPFQKVSAKPLIYGVSAKGLKSSSMSNNASAIITPKSASQTKRMVQKRLELVRIPPKIPRVDLSASEQYLGGERFPASKRKKEVGAESGDADANTFLCPTAGPENKKKAKGTFGEQKNEELPFDLDETCLPLDDPTIVPEQYKLTDEDEDSPSLFPDLSEEHKLHRPDLGLSTRSKGTKTVPSFPRRQVKPEVNGGNGMALLNQDVGSETMEIIADFNRRPRQDKDEPTFKYKPDTAVRKKAERDKLPAVPCDMCEEYYKTIGSQLTDSARAEIVDRGCKHRQQHKPREHDTPPGYWATEIPSTLECIQQGLMQVEKKSDAPNRHRI